MVITDSFHGCALSLNFNKNFIVQTTGAATRIENILQRFKLKNCLLENVISEGKYTEPNWTNINKILHDDRKEGIVALRNMIASLEK